MMLDKESKSFIMGSTINVQAVMGILNKLLHNLLALFEAREFKEKKG
jgi:hypothetical protein